MINLSFKIEYPEFVNYLFSDNWFVLWEEIMKKDDIHLTSNLLWLMNNLAITSKDLVYLIYDKHFFRTQLLPLLAKSQVDKNILLYGFSLIALGINYLLQPKYQQFQEIITKLLCDYHMLFKELTYDAIICLAHLSNLQNETIIKEIFTCGIIRRIIRREVEINNNNLNSSLQLIGNFITYVDDLLIDITVTKELVIFLKECLLTSQDSEIRKNACWCLSNLCLGNHEQIKCVIDENLVPIFGDIIKHDKINATFEAVYCISNILSFGEIDFALKLNTINIIELLIETVSKYETFPNIIKLCLESLASLIGYGAKIMKMTENTNLFLQSFENKGGKELLIKMTQYQNQEIFEMAVGIINQYYKTN